MPCCGQPQAGFVHKWHLRGLPGQSEPLEFDTQAEALAEQKRRGGAGTALRVTKKIS